MSGFDLDQGRPEVRDPNEAESGMVPQLKKVLLGKQPVGALKPVDQAGPPITGTPGDGDVGGDGGKPGGPGPEENMDSEVLKRLMGAADEDVDYLRGDPYSTTQEQAMRERMGEGIKNRFATSRQRAIDQMGSAQGMSGVLQSVLGNLDEQEAQELSDQDREIMVRSADEMRSRRSESRDLLGGLERLERGRNVEGMGLLSQLDENERIRLNDLLSALGMSPNAASQSGTASSLMQYGLGQGQLAGQRNQSLWQNIGDMASQWSKNIQPTPPPSYTGYTPPTYTTGAPS